MLAIEVDGVTHYDDALESQKRITAINTVGIEVLRFDAIKVIKETQEVLQAIEYWIINKEEQIIK
jgi:very-short-patch-repair endonuclease